ALDRHLGVRPAGLADRICRAAAAAPAERATDRGPHLHYRLGADLRRDRRASHARHAVQLALAGWTELRTLPDRSRSEPDLPRRRADHRGDEARHPGDLGRVD